MSEDNSIVTYRIIKEFPEYRVGSDGSVWSIRGRGRRPRPRATWESLSLEGRCKGYVCVSLNPGNRTRQVHTIVLEEFIGPCPKGMEACHFPDPDKTNNSLTNLRWGTSKENKRDSKVQGLNAIGVLQHLAKMTDESVQSLRMEH